MPPWALTLAWRCQRWGALPRVGGILDQDDLELSAMTIALEAHALVDLSMTSPLFNHALHEKIMELLDD